MKRVMLCFAVCALLFSAVEPMRGADVSINFFYDNLNGGNWYQVADYGYVWQPELATDPNWRPYTDGYWAYTDLGWTWVSYEDFGWATYHYGRWARLADYGWVWVPGYEWGPAWVSWRTGGDYVGWAPLPPAGPELVYEGRPVSGPVDVEFGIGPAYYNFVDVRYIGEPVLRTRIIPYAQNVTYITQTVNVTNITYNNGVVYNYGPDYGFLSAYSTRPIQRLTIERENIDPLQAVKSGNVTKVQGNKLVLAAPMKLQKSSAQIAPKQVKAKIDQPKLEKGWSVVSDPNAKAQLEQKFRSENRKNIPKPNIQPTNANAAANLNAAGSPPTGGEAAAAPSPVERGKGKKKPERFESANAPGTSPASSPAEQGVAGAAASPVERGKGKKKSERFESANTPGISPASSPAEQGAAGAAASPVERGKGKHQRERSETGAANAPAGSPGASPFEETRGKHKGQRFENQPNPRTSPTVSASEQGANVTGQEDFGRGKHKGRREESNENRDANPNVSPQGAEGGGRRGSARFEERNVPPAGGENMGPGGRRRGQAEGVQGQPQGGPVQPQPGQGQERQGQGKGKGKKAEPSPTPQ